MCLRVRVTGLSVEEVAPLNPLAHEGRAQRVALYDRLAQQQSDINPSLKVLRDPALHALQVHSGMAWSSACSHQLLPLGAFRFAWVSHLRLPVFGAGQRCQYCALSSGHAFQTQTTQSPRTLMCVCAAPMPAKSGARYVTWHIDTEQLVKAEGGAFHCTDIVAASPSSTPWALDIVVPPCRALTTASAKNWRGLPTPKPPAR